MYTKKTTATKPTEAYNPRVPRLSRLPTHPESSNKQVFIIVYRRVFFSLLIYAHTAAATTTTHMHAYI